MMRFVYYPGCSLKGPGKPYEMSLLSSFRRLGMEIKEIDDWNCCGATPYFSIDERGSVLLSLRNLALAEKDGYEKAYSVLISKDPSLGSSAFKKIADAIQALQTMPRNEYYEIASDDAKQKLIIKLQKEIQNILDELKITWKV